MFDRISQVFKSFSRYERYVFLVSFLVFIVSSVFLLIRFIDQNTFLAPADGGEYREGVIGQPVFVNPVLAGNNDVDRDLTGLIFNNLLDLAESYKVDEKGKVWSVRLKENVLWHDKEKITSDDVIFTIRTIQDPDARSPLFSNWQGVIVERVSEREVKLVLQAPYAFFEEVLRELAPIPKHLFGDIPPANLKLSNYNLEPVGSGPFQFVSVQKRRDGFITDYFLARNENYSGKKPYLKKLVFKFYPNSDALIQGFNSGAVDGFGGTDKDGLTALEFNHRIFEIMMPRYYAVFLNSNAQPLLQDKNIRLALDLAVDRRSLVEKIFNGRAFPVFGPFIFQNTKTDASEFSVEEAERILENGGWLKNDEGIREKEFVKGKTKEVLKLEFKLVVPETSFLVEAAGAVKENWERIGVKLDLIVLAPSEISDKTIKTRDYEMLLFGNIFGRNPDFFSFWHSSERFYPGLNLSLYNSESADTLIESIQRDLNEDSRKLKFKKLQSLIIQDKPAIFLFSPFYLYATSKPLGGFEEKFIPLPSGRFENIENWYLKTERRFK